MKARSARKFSLVFATMVALLSVCTAGVSTFAWFQAQANVNVSTTSSTTTITVAKPDETMRELFVFKDNHSETGTGADTDHKRSIIGAARPTASSIDFDGMKTAEQLGGAERQFYRLASNSNSTFYTSTSSFAPGESVHFALLIHGDGAKARTLTATSFVNGTGGDHRIIQENKSKRVSMGLAIDIYGKAIAGSFNSNSNVFTPKDGTLGTLVADFLKGTTKGTDLYGLTTDSASVPSSATIGSTASSESALFLYTIEFSNADSTYFKHVDSEGADIDTSPSDWSTTTYWSKSASGSSEVYQGLTFNISGLTVS